MCRVGWGLVRRRVWRRVSAHEVQRMRNSRSRRTVALPWASAVMLRMWGPRDKAARDNGVSTGTPWPAGANASAEISLTFGMSASVAVSFVGKLKTTAQMAAIVLLLYFTPLAGLPIATLGTLLIWIAALLTLASMVYYLVVAARALQESS